MIVKRNYLKNVKKMFLTKMSTESTNDKVFVENFNYETGNWKIDIWYEPYANINVSLTNQWNKMEVHFKERKKLCQKLWYFTNEHFPT